MGPKILIILAIISSSLFKMVSCTSESENMVEHDYNEEEVETSLRKLISNPKTADAGLDLESPETLEMLRHLIRKRLAAQRMHEDHNDADVDTDTPTIHKWESGACLKHGVKFPTLNLISFKSDSKNNNNNNAAPKDIQINKYYGVIRDRFYVRNNGNGALSFKFEPETPTSQATIRAKDWKDEYVLAKGDIYWSLNDTHGAQHAIDGQGFPLEIQLVHYLKSLGSLDKGAQQRDGIIVTSVLFEVSARRSPHLEPLARSVMSVGFPNEKWKQVHGPLDLKMLYPVDMSYLTYRGPYINEPCSQNALWFVFKQPLPVTISELQRLRELRRDNSKKSSGIFLNLALSKDEGGDKSATSSNGKIYLNTVRKETLSGGGGESRMKKACHYYGLVSLGLFFTICVQGVLIRT